MSNSKNELDHLLEEANASIDSRPEDVREYLRRVKIIFDEQHSYYSRRLRLVRILEGIVPVIIGALIATLIAAACTYVTAFLFPALIEKEHHFTLGLIVLVSSIISMLVVIAIMENELLKVLQKFSIVVLFILIVSSLFILFFHPEIFTNGESSPEKVKEIQVFLSVVVAGLFGGLMKNFISDRKTTDDSIDLWTIVLSAMTGLFVSLVLFLILRAGIVNQTSIDTFNLWGVTGVAAITGFFADNVIEKLSNVYDEVIGKANNNETANK